MDNLFNMFQRSKFYLSGLGGFSLEAGQVDGGFVNLPPGKFTITLSAWDSLATVYKLQLYWCVFTVRVLQ